MLDTPRRVLGYWQEFQGESIDAARESLAVQFECDSDNIVIVKDMPFRSLCEHHLLPFFGTASVAYIPTGKVVGLSKIPRALSIVARRPQLQERLTTQLGEVIDECLHPLGVAVVMSAEHTCMSARGIQSAGASTVTSYLSGVFKQDASARSEVFSLLK